MNTQTNTKKLYDRDGIVVRRSQGEDIEYLRDHMRLSDQNEIWASHHLYPQEALTRGVDDSIFCCTVLNGNPMAMFGIVPETLLGEKACVWLLASNDLVKIKRRFAKHSRYFVDMMLEYYPYLYNHVDDRNNESIAWLRFCGATIEEPKTYGVENMPFRYFYFTRNRRK